MAFMLFGSLGLSFSKISCPKGQRFVLGTEMPQYKKVTKHCCLEDKAEPKEDSDQKEDRKKETFQLKFDFKTSLVECIKAPQLDSYTGIRSEVRSQRADWAASLAHAYLFYGSSPPLLTKPELSSLQSFRI